MTIKKPSAENAINDLFTLYISPHAPGQTRQLDTSHSGTKPNPDAIRRKGPLRRGGYRKRVRLAKH